MLHLANTVHRLPTTRNTSLTGQLLLPLLAEGRKLIGLGHDVKRKLNCKQQQMRAQQQNTLVVTFDNHTSISNLERHYYFNNRFHCVVARASFAIAPVPYPFPVGDEVAKQRCTRLTESRVRSYAICEIKGDPGKFFVECAAANKKKERRLCNSVSQYDD